MSTRDRVLEVLTDARLEPPLFLAAIVLLLLLVGLLLALAGL